MAIDGARLHNFLTSFVASIDVIRLDYYDYYWINVLAVFEAIPTFVLHPLMTKKLKMMRKRHFQILF